MSTAPTQSAARPLQSASRPPSQLDATAARASGMLGGAWGTRAGVRRSSWWTPVRALLAMTVLTMLLGFAQKSPCLTGDWTGSKQYTHMCYSDVVPLWSDERLDVGAVPYRDTAVEYPVLTGGLMWAAGALARGLKALVGEWSLSVLFAVVTALLLSICALITTAATAQTARGRPYDAALFALSPLLVFHAFSNWDLLAMAFTSTALWAWARGRPVASGVLIGLGAAAKLYPALLLVALAILAVRTRRYPPVLWAGAAAALSWAAVNVPVALAYGHGWWAFYRFSIDRPTERSTVWAIVKTLAHDGTQATDATYWVPPGTAVAVALVVALLAVAAVGLAAPSTPRLGQLAFLVVLAFLLTTKVWSPQYSLWLVPLLALARPRWRLALVWQFVEVAVWFATLTLLLGLGESARGLGYGWLILLIVVRDALLLGLAGLIVHEMWRPDLDVVRTGYADSAAAGSVGDTVAGDPAAGDFRAATDHFARPVRRPRAAGADLADFGFHRGRL